MNEKTKKGSNSVKQWCGSSWKAFVCAERNLYKGSKETDRQLKKAISVSLHKGKDSIEECNNYRKIAFLMCQEKCMGEF